MKRNGWLALVLTAVLLLMAATAAASPARKYSIISFTMDQTQAHVTLKSYGDPVYGGRIGFGTSPNGHSGWVYDFGPFNGTQTIDITFPDWFDTSSGTKYYCTVWTADGPFTFQNKDAACFIYP